jgi:hypothetical protein
MDRFTRNYLIGLGAFVGLLAVLWLASNWHPGVAPLNQALEQDATLAAYPYRFRVLSLDDGVATMTSPRSFEVPVIRFLAVLDPRLAGRSDNDPDLMAAQAELARHQKRAQAIVQGQPQVKAVRWQLDRDWYAARGVALP